MTRERSRYLRPVRDQYESYPYPPRDPERERVELLGTWLGWLPKINHYCCRGRQDFRGYRALVAGAGTGDATIFLAEQLRRHDAEVVSLDLSRASTAVAKARARVRGLNNIRWVEASLLDLPGLGLGPFDHINCSGVLHHLERPEAGLAALRAVLKPEGSIGLMVYATYGRTAVYPMQELLRRINRGERHMAERVKNARALLAELPRTNWFARSEELSEDHKRFGDAGLYDMFLHARDRAYTVAELHAFVAGAGLKVAALAIPFDRVRLRPESYTRDPRLHAAFARMDPLRREAAAELISGAITMHVVFLSPLDDPVAHLGDPDMVPFLFQYTDPRANEVLADGFRQAGGGPVTFPDQLFNVRVRPGRYSEAIFRALDGERTLGEIWAEVRRSLGDPGLTDAALLADFEPVYRRFNEADRILLRHRSVAPFPDPFRGAPGPTS